MLRAKALQVVLGKCVTEVFGQKVYGKIGVKVFWGELVGMDWRLGCAQVAIRAGVGRGWG